MKDASADDIEQLLREADLLIQRIQTEVSDDLEEEKRQQLEARQAELKASSAKVAAIADDGKPAPYERWGAGIHEAIDDLVAAIKETARLLI